MRIGPHSEFREQAKPTPGPEALGTATLTAEPAACDPIGWHWRWVSEITRSSLWWPLASPHRWMTEHGPSGGMSPVPIGGAFADTLTSVLAGASSLRRRFLPASSGSLREGPISRPSVCATRQRCRAGSPPADDLIAGVSTGGLAVLLGMIPYGSVSRLDRRGLMVLAAAVLGLAVAYSIVIAWPAANRGGRPALALLLNHVFVGTSVIGFLFAPVAAPPTQGLVEEHSLSPPQTAFDYAYTPTDDDRGVLTIAHDGGDHIPVDRVWIHGEGFAAVEGADQTQAGRWHGETTARPDGQAGVVVEEGDSVGVGVTDGCVKTYDRPYEGREDVNRLAGGVRSRPPPRAPFPRRFRRRARRGTPRRRPRPRPRQWASRRGRAGRA